MIDCREQTVSINNPGTPMEAIIFINSSTPYNYTLHHKFSSSHELFCPITSFNITRIEDAYSEQDVPSAFDVLSIGSSITTFISKPLQATQLPPKTKLS
jgi:hypothetical protein